MISPRVTHAVSIPGGNDRLGCPLADVKLDVKPLHRRNERPYMIFMDMGPWRAERAMTYEELKQLRDWADSALALTDEAEAA